MCVCSCLSVSKYDRLGNPSEPCEALRERFCSPIVNDLRHHQQTFEQPLKLNTTEIRRDEPST